MSLDPAETSGPPFAITISMRTPLTLSLIHLISSLLNKPISATASFTEAMTEIRNGSKPELIISDFRDVADRAATFIKEVSELHPDTCHIAITDANDDSTTIKALLAGADDVVRYPFSLQELALRMRMRLGWKDDQSFDIDRVATVDWDAVEYVATQAHLTAVEAQIAGLLFGKNGDIVSRNDLSRAIDHRPWSYGDRKFDVHVAKIRKKLNSSFGEQIEVKTIRSMGYRLVLKDLNLTIAPKMPTN